MPLAFKDLFILVESLRLLGVLVLEQGQALKNVY